MTLGKLRSMLYRSASLLGDLQAVRNGTIIPRLLRKWTTKLLFNQLRALWRLFK